METVKRYAMNSKNPSKGADAFVLSEGRALRGVPEKYLETPQRNFAKRMLRVAGLCLFIMNAMLLIAVAVQLTTGILPIKDGVLPVSVIGMMLISHMGMFVESAADSGGVNWCAKTVIVNWLAIGGGLAAAIIWRVVLQNFF